MEVKFYSFFEKSPVTRFYIQTDKLTYGLHIGTMFAMSIPKQWNMVVISPSHAAMTILTSHKLPDRRGDVLQRGLIEDFCAISDY